MPKRKKRLKPGPQPDGSYILNCERPPDYSKLRPDAAEIAYRTMLEATGQAPKTRPGSGPSNREAVDRGRLGGQRGGKSRAKKLPASKRSAIAKKAAKARWRDR